jgi:membrane fusion protein, copper/silver efflux system
MRSPPAALIALAGLLAGAGAVALLPRDTLFVVSAVHDHAGEGMPGERWACPMMDFIGTKPGKCPVCGMQMTRVTAGELTAEQQRRMGVQLSKVTSGPAVVTVRAYGTADYDHRYTRVVIPRISGRIVKRHQATAGCCETVAAGAPVVDLYSAELIAAQGELAAAIKLGDATLLAALRERFAQWNLSDVAERIEKGGAVSDTVTIRTPFEGQVLLRDFEQVNESLEVGRQVAADTPLLRLVEADRLALTVHVPETRARFLTDGQRVEIESDDRGPLPEVEATIGRLGQEIDPQTRTREVRIYLTGARSALQPGSLVSAKIRAALGSDLGPATSADVAAQFTLVPKSAVLSTGVRHVAWRVVERTGEGRLRFEPASLALGPRLEDENGNDLYIVRAGLKPGDEVATQGAFLIDSQAQLAGTPSLLFPGGAMATPAASPAAAHPH